MREYQATPDFYNDYITHHGILNQKWGVRNGPPYPLSSKVSTGSRLKKPKDQTKDGIVIPVGLATYALGGVVGLTALGVNAARSAGKRRSIEKQISKSPKDPKTGLSLKQKEYTDKQDLDKVNPGRLTGDGGWHNNCASCTMTYELRRRGYEVTANKNTLGVTRDDYKKYFDVKAPKKVGNRKSSGGTGDTMVWANESTKQHKEYARSVISDLSKLPKGSRGNISVNWGFGGGHSMHYEITDAGLVIRDAQIKKIYTKESQLINLFSNVVSTSYFRLDNAKLKPKHIKEVCH